MLKLSVYALKSRFQLLLKPLLEVFIRTGISPNQITIFTCLLCVIYAVLLVWTPHTSLLLFLFPLLMFIRMALNALDGMLAAQTNSQTPLGAVLNEVCDVISDAVFFSAFLFLLSVGQLDKVILWWLLTLLVLLSEFVSLAVFQTNKVRSHSGPFGKSDRAVYLGFLAVLLWKFPELLNGSSHWLVPYIVLGVVLSLLTIWNRFKTLYEVN